MPITKKSLFKIEHIDQEKGHCVVKFINKYGPIETNEKTIEDFKVSIEYHTGSFYANGDPIMNSRLELVNNNPNDDITYNYDIPLNNDGSFITGDELIDYIARQYPENVFEEMNKRKNASKRQDYQQLINQEFDIDIEYPDPPVPSGIQFIEDV